MKLVYINEYEIVLLLRVFYNFIFEFSWKVDFLLEVLFGVVGNGVLGKVFEDLNLNFKNLYKVE